MRALTVFQYLIGSRRAILEIASNRKALIISALFVLSAGLARNYDRADLLREWYRLLGPFAASLLTSGVLFLAVYGFVRRHGLREPGIGSLYLPFLTLYWMTAPLAWLYGIPYERFLGPLDATAANLWTLALVSVWRVALMVRVVSVLFRLSVGTALPLVLLVADLVAIVILFLTPLPIFQIMGGIDLSASEAIIAEAAMFTRVVTVLTLPIWFFWTVVLLVLKREPHWNVPPSKATLRPPGALVLSVASVVFWLSWLPWTQPEQRLRDRTERLFFSGDIRGALMLMSAHDRSEYPPNWDPPPWAARAPDFRAAFGLSNRQPDFFEVLDTLADTPSAEWPRQVYLNKLRRRLRTLQGSLESPSEYVHILNRLPEGPELALEFQSLLQSALEYDKDLSASDREVIEHLLQQTDARDP